MKRHLLILIAFCLTLNTAHACDVCGCQLGGLSFGMLAGTNSHYFGLRYSKAHFNASIRYDSEFLSDEFSDDTFARTELLGRYMLSNKLQVHAIIPYLANTMRGNIQNLNFKGIGDPSLLFFYNVLAKSAKKSTEKTANVSAPEPKDFRQMLLIGGGVKLPLGKFDRFDGEAVVNRNFQIGTGSFDFLLSANYTLGYKRWGLNAEASYKINTRNKDHYLFGNQFNASGYGFYTLPIKNGVISPFVGVFYETAARHRDGTIFQFNTGGHALLGTLGAQVNWKSLSFSALFQNPLQQNYNSDAIATIDAGQRFSVGIIHHFARKKKKENYFIE